MFTEIGLEEWRKLKHNYGIGREDEGKIINFPYGRSFSSYIRELKQTMTTTVTRTSLNKRLMSKKIAVHMRYKFWYISLLSSTKQQREMTKFCAVYGT